MRLQSASVAGQCGSVYLEKKLRAFIAVELPPAARDAVEGVIRDLRARTGDGVRWVRPEGVHLTLKFLGDIDAYTVPALSQALDRCAAPAAPFDLCLEGVGAFPNARRPRVVWVGLGGGLEALLGLQQSIEGELEALGYARERRAFTPHLTLGRVRDRLPPTQGRALSEALGVVSVQPGVGMPVREVSLIKSDLRPSGAVYTRLHAAGLGGD